MSRSVALSLKKLRERVKPERNEQHPETCDDPKSEAIKGRRKPPWGLRRSNSSPQLRKDADKEKDSDNEDPLGAQSNHSLSDVRGIKDRRTRPRRALKKTVRPQNEPGQNESEFQQSNLTDEKNMIEGAGMKIVNDRKIVASPQERDGQPPEAFDDRKPEAIKARRKPPWGLLRSNSSPQLKKDAGKEDPLGTQSNHSLKKDPDKEDPLGTQSNHSLRDVRGIKDRRTRPRRALKKTARPQNEPGQSENKSGQQSNSINNRNPTKGTEMKIGSQGRSVAPVKRSKLGSNSATKSLPSATRLSKLHATLPSKTESDRPTSFSVCDDDADEDSSIDSSGPLEEMKKRAGELEVATMALETSIRASQQDEELRDYMEEEPEYRQFIRPSASSTDPNPILKGGASTLNGRKPWRKKSGNSDSQNLEAELRSMLTEKLEMGMLISQLENETREAKEKLNNTLKKGMDIVDGTAECESDSDSAGSEEMSQDSAEKGPTMMKSLSMKDLRSQFSMLIADVKSEGDDAHSLSTSSVEEPEKESNLNDLSMNPLPSKKLGEMHHLGHSNGREENEIESHQCIPNPQLSLKKAPPSSEEDQIVQEGEGGETPWLGRNIEQRLTRLGHQSGHSARGVSDPPARRVSQLLVPVDVESTATSSCWSFEDEVDGEEEEESVAELTPSVPSVIVFQEGEEEDLVSECIGHPLSPQGSKGGAGVGFGVEGGILNQGNEAYPELAVAPSSLGLSGSHSVSTPVAKTNRSKSFEQTTIPHTTGDYASIEYHESEVREIGAVSPKATSRENSASISRSPSESTPVVKTTRLGGEPDDYSVFLEAQTKQAALEVREIGAVSPKATSREKSASISCRPSESTPVAKTTRLGGETDAYSAFLEAQTKQAALDEYEAFLKWRQQSGGAEREILAKTMTPTTSSYSNNGDEAANSAEGGGGLDSSMEEIKSGFHHPGNPITPNPTRPSHPAKNDIRQSPTPQEIVDLWRASEYGDGDRRHKERLGVDQETVDQDAKIKSEPNMTAPPSANPGPSGCSRTPHTNQNFERVEAPGYDKDNRSPFQPVEVTRPCIGGDPEGAEASIASACENGTGSPVPGTYPQLQVSEPSALRSYGGVRPTATSRIAGANAVILSESKASLLDPEGKAGINPIGVLDHPTVYEDAPYFAQIQRKHFIPNRPRMNPRPTVDGLDRKPIYKEESIVSGNLATRLHNTMLPPPPQRKMNASKLTSSKASDPPAAVATLEPDHNTKKTAPKQGPCHDEVSAVKDLTPVEAARAKKKRLAGLHQQKQKQQAPTLSIKKNKSRKEDNPDAEYDSDSSSDSDSGSSWLSSLDGSADMDSSRPEQASKNKKSKARQAVRSKKATKDLKDENGESSELLDYAAASERLSDSDRKDRTTQLVSKRKKKEIVDSSEKQKKPSTTTKKSKKKSNEKNADSPMDSENRDQSSSGRRSRSKSTGRSPTRSKNGRGDNEKKPRKLLKKEGSKQSVQSELMNSSQGSSVFVEHFEENLTKESGRRSRSKSTGRSPTRSKNGRGDNEKKARRQLKKQGSKQSVQSELMNSSQGSSVFVEHFEENLSKESGRRSRSKNARRTRSKSPGLSPSRSKNGRGDKEKKARRQLKKQGSKQSVQSELMNSSQGSSVFEEFSGKEKKRRKHLKKQGSKQSVQSDLSELLNSSQGSLVPEEYLNELKRVVDKLEKGLAKKSSHEKAELPTSAVASQDRSAADRYVTKMEYWGGAHF